jgi:hypothetical protein
MNLTLHFDDRVAAALRQEASVECTSPEELARRLVNEALEQRFAERRWQEQNRRRLELIAKKSHTPLSAEEAEEFGRLQELACERASPFDRELRRMVEELQCAVERLPAESVP